jgi:hypothetical protein
MKDILKLSDQNDIFESIVTKVSKLVVKWSYVKFILLYYILVKKMMNAYMGFKIKMMNAWVSRKKWKDECMGVKN